MNNRSIYNVPLVLTRPRNEAVVHVLPTLKAGIARLTQKLILGTAQLGLDYGINNPGGKPSRATAYDILYEARLAGIRTLDTAEDYGDAIDTIAGFNRQHEPFEIITKFRYHEGFAPMRYIDQLLSRLKADRLHTLMLHRFSDSLRYPHLVDALTEARAQGKIQFTGVSVYTNHEFEAAIHNPLIDLVQLPYNLLDNFSKRGELMMLARQKNKIIHTRSVFLQGLFFRDTQLLSPAMQPLKPYLTRLHDIAAMHEMSIEALALNYALHSPHQHQVLFGVEHPAQLESDLASLHYSFNEQLHQTITGINVKETELLNPVNWK